MRYFAGLKGRNVLIGCLVACVYAALRWFWLDADAGICSAWEYGYNVTDEGYYVSGGKEKLLWGTFTDLARMEAYTYGYSAGTHLLSYLAHLCFGLSIWTWRLPFVLINFIAWALMFRFLTRRTGIVTAAVLCVACSCMPMIVAYERTASNDVLIGSLVMMAYVTAVGTGWWRVLVSAGLLAAVVLIKPSVWVLFPAVLAGVLENRTWRTHGKEIAGFLVLAVSGVFLFRLLAALAVWPDAAREGCSIFDVIRKTTTHYALPSLFAFKSHLRGLSAFPRDPSCTMLGFYAVLLVAFPVLFFMREAFGRRHAGRMLLFASVPLYIAAVSVMNTIYTHYFIPMIYLMPVLLVQAAASLREAEAAPVLSGANPSSKTVAAFGVMAAGVTGVLALWLLSMEVKPQAVQAFYSRIYNLPAENVWGFAWPFVLAVAAAGLALAVFFGGIRRPGAALGTAPAFLLAGSAACAILPAVVLAPYMKQPSALYAAPFVFNLAVGVMLLPAIVAFPRFFGHRAVFAVVLASLTVLGYVLMPNWRACGAELLKRGTYHHRVAAEEMRRILPDDAIVIGERSNQMLMSLPVRTVTTFPDNSDPISAIKRIRTRYPDAPLFALADSQHAYNLQHYRQHADAYELKLLKTFKMPSFATGKPADVYLCRIVEKRAGPTR